MEIKIAVSESEITVELANELGLSAEEFALIHDILGRAPTYTELGIYSVMWSEHCSYKNSIAVLKTLPRWGGRLLASAGEENAGLVDIGDGLAVAFKIESHNHPSAVEPYQGAATGVGGILRDIFTMGARPIATLNSLRFGNLNNDRSRYLFKNVVKGIGDYGNSFGVPTVAGEIYFDDCYENNPLVNAMAVGIVQHNQIARSISRGIGNPVVIVGSSTGRDGIHGATFASEEISESSEARRPAVQVGDPFTEKLLVEATLEAIASGHVIGVQDMGAAGITCSTTEMSAKGKSGMRIYLDRVPLREEGMSSYEIMLSESQERMLVVVKKGHEEEVQKIFNKWDLHGVIIGEVSDGNRVTVYHAGEVKADVPAPSLVLGEGAPVYDRSSQEPTYLKRVRSFSPDTLPVPNDLEEQFYNLLKRPTIASKQWAYDQYDSMVRTNRISNKGGDAAVVRVKETRKGLALTTDCNARYVYLNPRRGGQIAVAEAARNVVCIGAEPIAITNCLNFGNPYDPEIFWQFKEAVAGIGEACRTFGTPVTGGNVSFYNESPSGAVYPTPVIGMLGLMDDVENACSGAFEEPGDEILLFGKLTGEIGGSEYLQMSTGDILGDAPSLNLILEQTLQQFVLQQIRRGAFKSLHDVSEGGFATAIAECCFRVDGILGCEVRLPELKMRKDFLLFGESQSVIIGSCESNQAAAIAELAARSGIEVARIGRVTGRPELSIDGILKADLLHAKEEYYGSIARMMSEGGIGH